MAKTPPAENEYVSAIQENVAKQLRAALAVKRKVSRRSLATKYEGIQNASYESLGRYLSGEHEIPLSILLMLCQDLDLVASDVVKNAEDAQDA